MPFDFPNSPTLGQNTTAPNGAVFVWDGVKWTTAANALVISTGGPFLPLTGGTISGAPGTLAIGSGTGTPTLTLNGAAGTAKGIYWQNASISRWRLQTDASDSLALYAYDASGNYINAAFTAQQSDMSVWFNLKLATSNTNATPVGGITGAQFNATNTGIHPANGNKFVYTSNAGGGGFDCGLTSLAIFNTNFATGAPNPAQQSLWLVAVSPNDATHFFGTNCAEWNIVNRGPDVGWMRDRGSGRNPTGGLLLAPEVASFDPVAGGEGTNASYGISTAGSGVANSHGVYPRFYNNYLAEPNSTVGLTGRAIYLTGDITGTAANYPYGPLQIEGTWLHGIDHTLATYTDAYAATMRVGQGLRWITGGTTASPTAVATIAASGSAGNASLTLTPAGTGNITLAGSVAPFLIGAGTGTQQLTFNGATGVNNGLQWQVAGVTRWTLTTDASDDMNLFAYTGAGVFVGPAITCTHVSKVIYASFDLACLGKAGFNGTGPIAKPTISGSKGANAALTSLLTALASYGLVTDSST